jgi:hypothetical protein
MLTIGSQNGRPQVQDEKPAPPRIDREIPLEPLTKPASPSVETLIDQLEEIRKRKAELEAREKALVEQLQRRLKNQSDRLQKLGVVPAEPSSKPKTNEDEKFPDKTNPRDDLPQKK